MCERAKQYASAVSPGVLEPVVGYLLRAGVVPQPPPVPAPQPDAAGLVLERFGRYLAGQRALSAPVVAAYQRWAEPFTRQVLCPAGAGRCGELTAGEVSRFLADVLPAMSCKSAQMTACALRSLLRFLHATQVLGSCLDGVVPPVASWRLAGLPRGLQSSEIERLLDGCDRETAAGLRDYAILSLLAGLGLRGGEAAGLALEDIDWRAGEITVTGKGSRTERLPLPAPAGEAVAAWLTRGRPRCEARAVFVTVRRPYRQLPATSVRAAMTRACVRAGLDRRGAHQLRHALATEMLRAGASLPEVGQVLRHRSQLSTSVYAKVDQNALRPLARPWPGAAR